MDRKKGLSSLARVALYLVFFFLLLSVAVWIFLNTYLNRKIITSIKEQVEESSSGRYILTLGELDINPWSRSISISDLIIAPIQKELQPKAQYVFKAKNITVRSISVLSYLQDNDLVAGSIEFEEPQVSIFQGVSHFPKKNVDSVLQEISLYRVISKRLNALSVGQIDIRNAQFNVYKDGIDTVSVFASNDNSISIRDFNIDKASDGAGKLFSAKTFEIVLNNFSCQLGKGMYTLFCKRLHTSYTDSIMTLDSLLMIPNFDRKEFAEEAGRQISRINFMSPEVSCKKMDVKVLFEYNWLVADKVDISDCMISIHRDNRQPLAPIVRPSLQAMLKSAPFFISVDSVEMKNGTIVYQERNFDQAASEKVTVDKINGVITGMQNDSSFYSEKSSIKARLTASFMDKGQLTAAFDFPLRYTAEHFTCSGTLSAMPMSTLNVMIPRAKKIRFVEGQLDKASFSFIAKEKFSTGTMQFLYHDLKVELADGEDDRGLKNKLKTFLANELVIIDSNPDKTGKTRTSPIYVEHNPYRYFIFYSMQSIVSGMTAAIQDKENAKLLARRK